MCTSLYLKKKKTRQKTTKITFIFSFESIISFQSNFHFSAGCLWVGNRDLFIFVLILFPFLCRSSMWNCFFQSCPKMKVSLREAERRSGLGGVKSLVILLHRDRGGTITTNLAERLFLPGRFFLLNRVKT